MQLRVTLRSAGDHPDPRSALANPANLGWITSANNNNSGDTAQVKSVVIGIKSCPERQNGTVWGCVTTALFENGASAPSGYETLTGSVDPGFVLSSIGAWTNYATINRYLTDLIPRTTSGSQGITLRTVSTQPNAPTGWHEYWLMGIRKN